MSIRHASLRGGAVLLAGLATATITTSASADWSFPPASPGLGVPNQGTIDAFSDDQTISILNEAYGEPFGTLSLTTEGLSATAYVTSSTVGFTNSADSDFWNESDVTVSGNISPNGDQDVLIEWDFGADSAWGGGQIGVFHSTANEIIFLADVLDGDIAGSMTLSLIGGDEYQLFAGSGNGTGDAWGTFTAVPAPGAIVLLGLAGITGTGRRRRH